MTLPEPFAALAQGDPDRLVAALAHGADPGAKLPVWPGWAPLHAAIEAMDEGASGELLALLLRAGAPVDGAPDAGDATPLQMAVLRGRHDAALLLLAAGADPLLRRGEHGSPLFIAAEAGDRAMARTLLRAGAAPDLDQPGGLRSITPLGVAAARLDTPMVQLLLAAGASPTAEDIDGRRPAQLLPAVGDQAAIAAIRAILQAAH